MSVRKSWPLTLKLTSILHKSSVIFDKVPRVLIKGTWPRHVPNVKPFTVRLIMIGLLCWQACHGWWLSYDSESSKWWLLRFSDILISYFPQKIFIIGLWANFQFRNCILKITWRYSDSCMQYFSFYRCRSFCKNHWPCSKIHCSWRNCYITIF